MIHGYINTVSASSPRDIKIIKLLRQFILGSLSVESRTPFYEDHFFGLEFIHLR